MTILTAKELIELLWGDSGSAITQTEGRLAQARTMLERHREGLARLARGVIHGDR